MQMQGLLFELLLTGFFAVACLRARAVPIEGAPTKFADLFSFRGRIERLQRSRWQWCSIVVLLIIARMQWGLSMVVELTFAVMLILFLLIPTRKPIRQSLRG